MMNNKEKQEYSQSEYDLENVIEQSAETAEEQASCEEVPEKPHAGKQSKSKEVKKLEEELKKAIGERDAFKDSYMRTFSDYNNYKKRNLTVASQANKAGTGDVLEKILPVLDNLERALEHVDDDSDDGLAKGVSMVYKQLSDIIASMGVKEIPALGENFDPNLHHAIQQQEAGEGEQPDKVVAVVQKGYMLDDRILRHSMVVVSK